MNKATRPAFGKPKQKILAVKKPSAKPTRKGAGQPELAAVVTRLDAIADKLALAAERLAAAGTQAPAAPAEAPYPHTDEHADDTEVAAGIGEESENE